MFMLSIKLTAKRPMHVCWIYIANLKLFLNFVWDHNKSGCVLKIKCCVELPQSKGKNITHYVSLFVCLSLLMVSTHNMLALVEVDAWSVLVVWSVFHGLSWGRGQVVVHETSSLVFCILTSVSVCHNFNVEYREKMV